jgi:hypothetical protein
MDPDGLGSLGQPNGTSATPDSAPTAKRARLEVEGGTRESSPALGGVPQHVPAISREEKGLLPIASVFRGAL